MSIEDTVRGIVESNRKTRAELSQLSARVIHATLSEDPEALYGIIAELDPGVAEALQEPEQDSGVGGSAGNAEPTGGSGGAAEEPRS